MRTNISSIKKIKSIVLTDTFQFNKSNLFLTDVPYVIFGALSLIFNFNSNFIIKSND